MTNEKKFYLTKEGLKRIEKEYRTLKNLRLVKTRGEAPKIWESEDLNPEYLSFQEDLNLLESRISELENVLSNACLIKTSSREKPGTINLGSTVEVEIDGVKDEFTIVGTLESNPGLGKISNESPVGCALLGHRVGDEVVVSSPVKTNYKILNIRYQKS
ncbi:MAG: transcription elongation factor GreA [Candidatus Nealsonbacteria bacterium]|nr:transcription elongation factor GreA [Candidatus Nealsonbacteria bacterium]